MKKKILSIVLCCALAMMTLTACGKDEEKPAAETKTEEAAPAAEEKTEVTETAAEATEMCSDDNFKALQEAYAGLVEEYNAVNDYYLNNDAIEQSDDVEEALAQSKEYLDTVAEIEQGEINDADAVELANSMIQASESLLSLTESLGIMEQDGTMVSDEDFAALQDAYSGLVEEYNAVVDYYMNNDSISADEVVEGYLAEAKNYIEQMGEVKQEELSETNAAFMAKEMIGLAKDLEDVANSLGQ